MVVRRSKAHSDATRSFASSLRELRKSRNASLQTLSARAKVSRSMISKVERNEVQPSLNVAVRLAAALGTTLPEMLRQDEYARVLKLPHKEQAVIRNTAQGWERHILSPSFHNATVDISRVALGPKVKLGSFPPHPRGAEEHIVVLKGKLRVKLDGTVVMLEERDTLFFEGNRRHVIENASARPAEFLVVIKK